MLRGERAAALAGALAACLLFGFGTQVYRASEHVPSEQQSKGTNETKGDTDAVAPTATISTDKPHVVQDGHDASDDEKQAIWKWIADFFEIKLTDLLIALFTGLLAWKTAGLFRETAGLREAADDQREELIRSSAATEKAANATQKSADIAKSALTDLERPYLVPGRPKLKFIRYGQPGMPVSNPPLYDPFVAYSFHNMGRTVGFLKEATVELIFSEFLPPQPQFADQRMICGHFPIGVGNGYECPTLALKDHIDLAKYTLMTNGKLRPYLFRYVKYSDVFGYLHTEGFCFLFTKFGGTYEDSECIIIGSNLYNYSRAEKIPPEGFLAMQPQGAELSWPLDKLPR